MTPTNGVMILLPPSKTMDFISPIPYGVIARRPLFAEQAGNIAAELKKLDVQSLMKLMVVSQPIALNVHDYYAAWDQSATGRPALWTYVGDVYRGLQARTLTYEDAKWAQDHLLISSGLYGLVRPFDGIQAYRLEMSAALAVGQQADLYQFWGDKLAEYVDGQGSDWLCNCSSAEYARPVIKYTKIKVITPVFMDVKPNGTVGSVPIYSKQMRGVLARWMIDNRVSRPDELTKFSAHDYSYDTARSTADNPVFSRAHMAPLKFA